MINFRSNIIFRSVFAISVLIAGPTAVPAQAKAVTTEFDFSMEAGQGQYHSRQADYLFQDDFYAFGRPSLVDRPFRSYADYLRMGISFGLMIHETHGIVLKGSIRPMATSGFQSVGLENYMSFTAGNSGTGLFAPAWAHTQIVDLASEESEMHLVYEFRHSFKGDERNAAIQLGLSHYNFKELMNYPGAYADSRYFSATVMGPFLFSEEGRTYEGDGFGDGVYLRGEHPLNQHWLISAETAYYPSLRGNSLYHHGETGVQIDTTQDAGYYRWSFLQGKLHGEMERYEGGLSYQFNPSISMGFIYRREIRRLSMRNRAMFDQYVNYQVVPDPTSKYPNYPFKTLYDTSVDPSVSLENLSDWNLYQKRASDSLSLLLFFVKFHVGGTPPFALEQRYREVLYPDHTLYRGNFRNGLYDGMGSLEEPNGTSYTGEWKRGMRDGEGQEVDASGNRYRGGWQRDKKNGAGTMHWADGSEYTGQFKNDLPDGFGSMKWADGGNYSGEWSQGKRNGRGRMVQKSGVIQEGIWREDFLVSQ